MRTKTGLMMAVTLALMGFGGTAKAQGYNYGAGGPMWGTGNGTSPYTDSSTGHVQFGVVASQVQDGSRLTSNSITNQSAGVINNISTNGNGNSINGNQSGINSGNQTANGTFSTSINGQ